MRFLAQLFITLIVAEFGLHVIYHAITGKAGLYDPPFDYLVDIYKSAKRAVHDKIMIKK